MENKLHMLSTASLNPGIIERIKASGIAIDVIPFTEIVPCIDDDLRKQINELANEEVNVVFTSANAVKAVVGNAPFFAPFWSIYCIEGATQKAVKECIGENAIAGVALNASALAMRILQHHEVDRLYFFCGDQRLDTLPDTLRKAGKDVQEVIVYKTVATPYVVAKEYDAVLFYSPGGVNSFFSVNSVSLNTKLFAIGETTAAAISAKVKNEVVISSYPSKEKMIMEVLETMVKH